MDIDLDVDDNYVDDDCEIRRKYDRYILMHCTIHLV